MRSAGQRKTPHVRIQMPHAFSDGIGAPNGESRPLARTISNRFAEIKYHPPSHLDLNQLHSYFGHFVALDIIDTGYAGGEKFPIEIPRCDK